MGIYNPSTGDISGPASSTDNAIARWDGTGGNTLQNSGITIDDSDILTTPSHIKFSANVAFTASDYEYGRTTGGLLQANVPTGFSHRWTVNGVAAMSYDVGGLHIKNDIKRYFGDGDNNYIERKLSTGEWLFNATDDIQVTVAENKFVNYNLEGVDITSNTIGYGVNYDITNTAPNSFENVAFKVLVTHNDSNNLNNAMTAMQFKVRTMGGATDLALAGVQGIVEVQGGSTATYGIGGSFGSNVSTASTITNNVGVLINNHDGVGTTTNDFAFGIGTDFISNQSISFATGGIGSLTQAYIPYSETSTYGLETTSQDIVVKTNTSGAIHLNAADSVSIGANINNSITISGVSVDSLFAVETSGGTDLADVNYHRHSDTAGFGSHIIHARTRGTHASPSALQDNDIIHRDVYVGHDGTDYEEAVQVDIEVDGTVGANQVPGAWVLKTANTSGTLTEAIRVDSSQRLDLNSGLKIKRTTVNNAASPYSVLVTDYYIEVDSSGGVITLNLPAAATVGAGTQYIIKDTGNAGTNAITVDGNGSETIDGATTVVLNVSFDSITIVCDGSNWFII